MGGAESKSLSLPSPCSDLSRHLLWCIQESARLDDAYHTVRATLLHASAPLYTAIDAAVLIGQLSAHVKWLTAYADDVIHNSDPTQSAVAAADIIAGYVPLSEPAVISQLAANIYRDEDGDGARERGMPVLSAAHSSCKERMDIAARYLILQSINAKMLKAASMANKVRERDAYAVARLSRTRRKNLSASESDRFSRYTADAREHVGRIIDKSDSARQTFCWLYKDFQLANIMHALNETVRIIRGVRCRWTGRAAEAYEYPRKLGIGDESPGAAVSDAPLDPTSPQIKESLIALNALSTAIAKRQSAIDSIAQMNERNAMAVAALLVDSAFRIALSGEQIVGMSPRLVSLLGLHNRTTPLSVGELRVAVANMRLRIDTLSAAIVAVDGNSPAASASTSSSYHRRELIAECAVEKRALRDVFKYFHPPIARYCYDQLDDEVRRQSADVGLIYEELARVEKACAHMFPPPLSDPPPTRLPIQSQPQSPRSVPQSPNAHQQLQQVLHQQHQQQQSPSVPSSSHTSDDVSEEKSLSAPMFDHFGLQRPSPLSLISATFDSSTAQPPTINAISNSARPTSPPTSKRVGFQLSSTLPDAYPRPHRRTPSPPSSSTSSVPPSPSLPNNHHSLPSPSSDNRGQTPTPPPRLQSANQARTN